MPSLPETLTFLREAGQVQRAHTYFKHGNDTVAHHCYNLVNIILLLCPNPSVNLIRAAMWHDAAERYTGDIPSPAKKAFPDLKEATIKAEKQIEAHYNIAVLLTDDEKAWIKGADKLEYILWCQEQIVGGNNHLKHRLCRAMELLKADADVPDVIKQYTSGGPFNSVVEADQIVWTRKVGRPPPKANGVLTE